jgi:dolichyl-phosphate-mannose--protein O-mannosyl transferase
MFEDINPWRLLMGNVLNYAIAAILLVAVVCAIVSLIREEKRFRALCSEHERHLESCKDRLRVLGGDKDA